MKQVKPPLFLLLFFVIFGCVGLTIIGFLWTADGPPLFFRIFGSFVGLAFAVMGFGVPLTALKSNRSEGVEMNERPSTGLGYKCPNCAAGLDNQEVSPAGDVKCAYCSKWYNIHA
jgi:hypothetical protein